MASTRRPSLPARIRRERLAGAPRGPRKHDVRRDALLDAAALLFVERGQASTTIDDIATQAGVAKGTFYHYFKDRAAMLEALRDQYSRHFLEHVDAAIAPCPDNAWDARLGIWIETTIAYYLATYALHDVLFHEPAIAHRHPMGNEPIVQSLAALIAGGAAAGTWAVDEPVAVAVIMFYGLHGAVDEAIVTSGDTEAIAPRMTRLYRNMIRAG